MADPSFFTAPVVELVGRSFVSITKRIGYVHHLKENIQKLQSATEKLSAVSKDVNERVEREEAGQRPKRTNEVDN